MLLYAVLHLELQLQDSGDASGYPAVQEAYPAAPGSALVGIKFFVSLSGMVYPLLVVHNANSGNWKLNVMIPVVMSIICLVLAIIAPFVYDDQKKASEGTDGKSKDAVQAEIDAAKAAMLTKPGKFVVFLVMFYAFLVWQSCMVLSSIQKRSDYPYVDFLRCRQQV